MNTMQAKRIFRLYAKVPGRNRYHAIDWSTGKVCVNLIHATLFSEETATKIKADLPDLHAANPGFKFKVLKVRGPA